MSNAIKVDDAVIGTGYRNLTDVEAAAITAKLGDGIRYGVLMIHAGVPGTRGEENVTRAAEFLLYPGATGFLIANLEHIAEHYDDADSARFEEAYHNAVDMFDRCGETDEFGTMLDSIERLKAERPDLSGLLDTLRDTATKVRAQLIPRATGEGGSADEEKTNDTTCENGRCCNEEPADRDTADTQEHAAELVAEPLLARNEREFNEALDVLAGTAPIEQGTPE